MNRNIRELEIQDIDSVINYFLKADRGFLLNMGVDPNKLPGREKWYRLLVEDVHRPIRQKEFYYVIWELDGTAVGHSNINKITYGKEAYMHLHLWRSDKRREGYGTYFINESILRYFDTFDLQHLYCEPYSLNPAPNRTLRKAGFTLLKTYETTPGWINFRQLVNRWVLTRE